MTATGDIGGSSPPGVERPLLLLDVDGVINVLGRGSAEGASHHVVGGALIRVGRHTAHHLQRLGSAFHLVWATAWEKSANELGPLLGLPPLPHISFEADSAPGETWKLSDIREFVGERAVAWIDDDIGVDAELWAESRTPPTLLVKVAPDLGLSAADTESALRFAAERANENPLAKEPSSL